MTFGHLAYLTALRIQESMHTPDDWWELTDECRKAWNVQAHSVLLTYAKEHLTYYEEV